MKKIDVEKIKKDFPIFSRDKDEDFVYLDTAATSQTPDKVIEAMNDYYRTYRSNIHRGFYELGKKATHTYEGARKTTADFIGAENNEIIFTCGATISSNMLIYSIEQSFELNEGDEIVTSVMEHHANLIPLQELAKRKKLVLKHIPINEDFELDYKKAKKLITEKTKIVSVPLVSNVLGTVNDVRKITEYAHSVGALVITDATAEAVGHIPVDVKKLDTDFLFFSGHKMCGPTGTGVLYGKQKYLDEMSPGFFGGGIVDKADLQDASWTSSPTRFEPGTPNIAGIIGLEEAMKYLKNIGIESIHSHVQELVKYTIEELEKMGGVKVVSQKNPTKNAGIVSFVINGVHPHDVAEIAGRDGVAIRGGHHCAQPLMGELGIGAIARVSFYLYNDKHDVDMLINSVKKAQKLFLK